MNAEKINEFVAASVACMDEQTKDAWDRLTDSEKKLVAANSFFFVQSYNQAQRSNNLIRIRSALLRN